MTLLLIKLGLPILLGYALFAGIAGKLNPFIKPESIKRRPAWLLGLWMGLLVTMVLIIGLHMAYQMPVNAAQALLKPSTSLLLGLLIPGLLIYFCYGHLVYKELSHSQTSRFDWLLEEEQTQPEISKINPQEITPAYLPSAEVGTINIQGLPEALNDAIQAVTDDPSTDTASAEENLSLRARLSMERSLRKETEKHLQFARKALASLESEVANRDAGNSYADPCVMSLKRDLVNAKQELRRSNAARAKALGTANKSIAFARQAVQVRTTLETQLANAHEALNSKQTLVSSLRLSLQQEKRRSQMIRERGRRKNTLAYPDIQKSVNNDRKAPAAPDDNHGKAS